MSVGLIIVVPIIAHAHPVAIGAGTGSWLVISGVGNVAGLLLAYFALRAGEVAVVAPLLSTEGAIAALFAVAGGERLRALSTLTLLFIATGVGLVASETPHHGPVRAPPARQAVLLALAAAMCFGASLYATGRVSVTLPIGWALLPARLVGVLAVAAPLAARRRWRLTRRALPWVILGGACEVGGAAGFAIGARQGLAISAVLGSQFATFAAIAGVLLFHERLGRRQVSGVAVVAVGVAVLSALQVR
jgi:drug/metabolite transporter (DMT)-like permease